MRGHSFMRGRNDLCTCEVRLLEVQLLKVQLPFKAHVRDVRGAVAVRGCRARGARCGCSRCVCEAPRPMSQGSQFHEGSQFQEGLQFHEGSQFHESRVAIDQMGSSCVQAVFKLCAVS
jgi:hypothetical protein